MSSAVLLTMKYENKESENYLTKTCLNLYTNSVIYRCDGKIPCTPSINDYDKCIILINEWKRNKMEKK